MRKAVLIDIDGVLADASARFAQLFHHGGDEPDWPHFHSLPLDKDPVLPFRHVLDTIAQHVSIILLTNRWEHERQVTSTWAFRHRIRYDTLEMRPDGSEYANFKRSRIEHLSKRYEIVWGADDDPFHSQVYADFGIPFIYIHSGYNDKIKVKSDTRGSNASS